jgi:UDP-glucose 4-epimerase
VRILVTGATGLLGREVVEQLRRRGDCRVWGVGRTRDPDGRTIRVDLGSDVELDGLPLRVDSVAHLAAHVPAIEKEADPGRCFRDNVRATLNLLEYAGRVGVRRFVHGSSCAVYGPSLEGRPFDERDPPAPDDPYALSKLSAEELLLPYAYARGLSTCALRFSYLYGPGMRKDTVVSVFLDRALAGEPLVLVRGGRDRFDLLYVKDAAEAVTRALFADASGVFNVGAGRSTSIGELARSIVRVTASRSGIRDAGGQESPRVIELATETVRRELGWVPRHDLERGLADFLARRDRR